jgi:DNA polymerase-3 subunit alpha
MSVYVQILDHVTKDKKNNMAGQMSLFDIVDEEAREDFDLRMPDVGEYSKEMKLGFEKEVLGIYVSGHPMEEYREIWSNNVTNKTNDFALDEETNTVSIADQARVVVGGIIAGKTVKYTKNDQMMAFLTLEDMVGSVEIIVFPKSYETYGKLLTEDEKIFVRGRSSVEEDKDAKLICEEIYTFAQVQENGGKLPPANRGGRNGNGGSGWNGGNGWNSGGGSRQNGSWNGSRSGAGPTSGGMAGTRERTVSKVPCGVWIQFADAAEYDRRKGDIIAAIADSEGTDDVVVYLKAEKSVKVLPPNLKGDAKEALGRLQAVFGAENVRMKEA